MRTDLVAVGQQLGKIGTTQEQTNKILQFVKDYNKQAQDCAEVVDAGLKSVIIADLCVAHCNRGLHAQ